MCIGLWLAVLTLTGKRRERLRRLMGKAGGNMLQQEKTRYVDFTYLSFPYLVAKFNPPSEPRKRN